MPRALLSVSDKTGLVPLARGLIQAGFTLISTGGTYQTLADAGLTATQVGEVTGFPEILGGRVKTLHPAVHAGILARDVAEHRKQLEEHEIEPIDVVVVNLYPFRETVARPGTTFEEAVEQIDIGGPAMVRAAAKNHERVWVVTDPGDYPELLRSLASGPATAGEGGGREAVAGGLAVGDTSAGYPAADAASFRLELALKAFAHTASYDAAIADYLGTAVSATPESDPARDTGTSGDGGEANADETLPRRLVLELERDEILRYGENPHQRGARYRETGARGWWEDVRQHKGTGLSYLNVFDAEAAWRLAFEFDEPACVIVKHANPCGVASAAAIGEAYELAYEADPKSAFGGIVALNRRLDETTAQKIMANAKADVLLAPEFEPGALELLNSKRKSMRVLEARPPGERERELRRISGGFLVQEPDLLQPDRSEWRVVTEREPTPDQWRDLTMAWVVCARTSSNAIVLVKDQVAVGIGAGQQSRVDAAEIAARKAAGRAAGGACASDAFYPFRDGLDAAASAGVAAVIQPGGSVRDDELIAAANEHGIAMVFTGRRHFRH